MSTFWAVVAIAFVILIVVLVGVAVWGVLGHEEPYPKGPAPHL